MPPVDSSRLVAEVVGNRFLRDNHLDVDDTVRRDLSSRIHEALVTAALTERKACGEVCASRSQLWQSTSEANDTASLLRTEARCRANEALVLMDEILSRHEGGI